MTGAVRHNYIIRYYPSCEITKYPWMYRDHYHEQLPKEIGEKIGHKRMGNMGVDQFDKLKNDIEKHGIENPFIIEWYRKGYPNKEGCRIHPVLAIRTGNNRAEILHQLGRTHAPALFIVPKEVVEELPLDPYVVFGLDRYLEGKVAKLWNEVKRDDDDPLGIVGAWRDSVLLTDLIRECRNVNGPS